MKTILAATDFSPAGHNACVYGVELAKALNARLIIFSAFQQVPVVAGEIAVIITAEDMRKGTQDSLDKVVSAIDPNHLVSIETICAEDRPSNAILEVAVNNNVDLIVTGMKSHGKGFRKMLGSTVTGVVRKTTIPVIVVPEVARYRRIDTIAVANESDIDPTADINLLDVLRDIAERFQPKLYLVRVARNSFNEAFCVMDRPLRLTKLMRDSDPVYECIAGKHIPQALNEFIDRYDVHLLALFPHKLSLTESLFIKSVTRATVFETHIPLLVLPGLLEEYHKTHSDKDEKII